jgi:hypothetical protein
VEALRVLSKLRKWRDLDSIVGKNGWDEMLDLTLEAADRFHERIAAVPVGADRTRAPRTMMLRDIVAHIIDMNFAIGTIIECLGQNKSVTYNVDSFFGGAGRRSWAELLQEHRASRDWLEEVTASPVSSLRKKAHHLYGPLSAREWMGLAIRHYEYHSRQLDRILESPQYQVTARLAEESRKASG